MEHSVKWYSVQVLYTDRVPFSLFGELEKGSLFISAGGRLCGPHAAAYLEDELLTEKYISALVQRRKKLDPNFMARAVQMSSNNKMYRSRIAKDTLKVSDKLTAWGISV
ncbi:hypothetical protein [Aeromonas caviae]|uniref:hypothetical protein n=1 Tax=Aeromonas caviae TaxID=648 RepID=UPI002B484382|nr:hypothetical protein [Aeromonas caviae]